MAQLLIANMRRKLFVLGERQLGVDSQAKHENEAAKEADAIANEALYAGGSSYSEENPGPNGETFSLRNRLDQTEFNLPAKAPAVVSVNSIGLPNGKRENVAEAGRKWLSQNTAGIEASMPAPFVLSARGIGKMKQVKFQDGEDAAAHFEAVATLPELLKHSEVLAKTPDVQGADNVAFYERRYAWGLFPDGKRRHVLLTVRYLTKAAEPPRMYSVEALEVRNAPEAFHDGTPGGQTASPSAATGLGESLSDFMAGVKPEHKTPVETFSLRKFDFSSRLAPAAATLQGMKQGGLSEEERNA